MMLPLGPHRLPAFVTAIYRDYARQEGAITIDGRSYVRLTGDTARGEAAIELVPGADPGATMKALRDALPPTVADSVQIVPTRALKERALAIFDRSFAITYGLELVAILVGLAGVAATASAQTIARTREFGMLRHIGVTRRQIIAMLGMEGALLGLIGAIAGVALGCGLAQVLIRVVNPQSFNWTMETRLPVGIALRRGAGTRRSVGTHSDAGRAPRRFSRRGARSAGGLVMRQLLVLLAMISAHRSRAPRPALCRGQTRRRAGLPARSWRTSGLSHRMVVSHRLAGWPRRHAQGLPDHLLPHRHGIGRRQPERLCAAPDPVRPCRAVRPRDRPSAPRRKDRARGAGHRRRVTRRCRRRDRRLAVASPARRSLRRTCRGRWLRARSRLPTNPAGAGRGRSWL